MVFAEYAEYKTKFIKPSLTNQTYQNKLTKPNQNHWFKQSTPGSVVPLAIFNPSHLKLRGYLRREATENLLLEGDIASLVACLKMSPKQKLAPRNIFVQVWWIYCLFKVSSKTLFNNFRDLAMAWQALDLKGKQCLLLKPADQWSQRIITIDFFRFSEQMNYELEKRKIGRMPTISINLSLTQFNLILENPKQHRAWFNNGKFVKLQLLKFYIFTFEVSPNRFVGS